MLTPEKIAELRELLEKATPGDWWGVWCGLNVRNAAEEAICACGMQRGGQKDGGNAENHANAALIAAMKTALPDLLDAAEELARVKRWARQPHVCGGTCANSMNGGNCGTCTSGGRNAEYAGEPGWTDNFRPEWDRERRDIPPTQAFRELREEFGHHFADIDVDTFCHDVRYGKDEEGEK